MYGVLYKYVINNVNEKHLKIPKGVVGNTQWITLHGGIPSMVVYLAWWYTYDN